MWPTIGLAVVRQARVSAGLSIRRASRLAVRLSGRTPTVIPAGIRVAAVFPRGYAQATAKKKSATAKKPAAAKKTTTTTKKAAASKKKTAKASKTKTAKKAAPKKKKKELTDEEKTKLKIRELKKKALLKEVPRLPANKWMLFFSQRMKEELQGKSPEERVPMKELAAKITSEYKALSAEQLEKLEEQAQQNKVANEVAYKNWIESHSPQEIAEANRARQRLKRVYSISTKNQIPDTRLPKQPLTAYMAFVKSRMQTSEYSHEPVSQRIVKISAEWKKLSAAERKPFEDIHAADVERYNKEKEAVQAAAAA